MTWSPMLEQYFGMKHRYPEAILLSRVGDFYEAYGEDAETIARALSIALTSKEAGGGRRVAMAGVPHHALDGYLAKLVAQRRVVALAEQLEAPIPNKLVRRDVVRVVTPGTLFEEHILESKTHNYLAAITAYDGVVALAHADISTGHVSATAFDGESALEDVIAEIARLEPAELVADVPADVREALDAALENAQTRVAQPVLAAVAERVREPIDGFSFDASLAMHRALDALSRVRAPRQRAARRRHRAARGAVLPAGDLPRARPEHAQEPRAHQGARCEPARDAARNDRPHPHRHGLPAARPLAARAAGRSGRDRSARRRRRDARARRRAPSRAAGRAARLLRPRTDRSEDSLPPRAAARSRLAAAHPRAARPDRGRAARGVAAGADARDRGARRRLRRGADRAARDARRRPARDARRRRRDPARGERGAGRVRRAARRRALADRRARRSRARAHRDQVAQGEVRLGLRLRDRSAEGAGRERSRRLHAQADARERRALRDAGAARARRRDLFRRGASAAAGAGAVRSAGRADRRARSTSCSRPPTRSPSSTRTARSRKSPASAVTCARRSPRTASSRSSTAGIR